MDAHLRDPIRFCERIVLVVVSLALGAFEMLQIRKLRSGGNRPPQQKPGGPSPPNEEP